RELAGRVAAGGIKRIEGRVLVDASLFREGKGQAGGTDKFTVSAIMINDNLIDVVVTPAGREGQPAGLRMSPETRYVKMINRPKTIAPSKAPGGGMVLGGAGGPRGPNALRFADDVTNADGTHTVTLTGNIPLGSRPVLRAYRVPEPVRFAQMVLSEALR